MSKNRIKHKGPVILTTGQLDLALGTIRELTIFRNQHQLALEERRKDLDEEFGPALKDADTQIERLTELVRGWAEANPEQFGKLKSLERTHAVIGFRTGTPKVKTLTGWTFDRVLEYLRSVPSLRAFIRVKEEVNKDAIIDQRENLLPDDLRNMGVKVVQEESFFVEPKIEEVENRQTVATN